MSDVGPIKTHNADERYSPYAVDWRFLPDEALLAKDFIRHCLCCATNRMANTKILSQIWANTIGRRTISAVKAAHVLFIHIPKTGGTSISKCLYGRNLPHYTAEFYHRLFARSVSSLPSFAVVRHPVERAVSAYKMAVAGGTDIVAYSRYHRRRLAGLDSFDSFVDFIFESRGRLSSLPLELREQAGFILDNDGRVIVDRLFSMDSRNGLPPELNQWLGVRSMPHLNATKPQLLTISAKIQSKISKIYSFDFEIYDRIASNNRHLEAKGLSFYRRSNPQIAQNRLTLATDDRRPDDGRSPAPVPARSPPT
jgi:hypothetical protein